ncbi:MAG: electron transport complex subunit RsxC [Clostridia bacterium]|nr:electron transport complex subunit RsxC [Clostridia bacterium]
MSMFSLPGVHAPHRKNTAGLAPVVMPPPATVTIPAVMHIGRPAKFIVKAGDTVQVGQLIAEADGPISAPIHASVSGTVKKLDTVLLSGGNRAPAVLIASDGEMTVSETVAPPTVTDYASFIEAIRQSGIVGLGGAGFPTAVKLDIKDTTRCDTVLINGAECEPYITSDTRTMIDRAEDLRQGVELLKKYLGTKRVLIGIEKNKPEAIKKMKETFASDGAVSVVSMPSLYPQGGEKVLIYNLTRRIVPEGKLPIDVGVIVINCTTLAEIAAYIRTGMPLVSKCVTFDGSAVAEPKNVLVPIGTSVADLAAFAGGYKCEPKKLLYGGLMMGIALPDATAPVLKNTNAILALDEKDAAPAPETPCLRCGKCVDHCPIHLSPVSIAIAHREGDCARLADLKVNLCMECGCCSYVCPAHRPLVQTNRLSKAMLRAHAAKEQAKEEKKA